MSTPAARIPRGRPRDPTMEQRVLDAALEVYAERGWSGFTLDGVARTAKVGNAAIYRRWSSKEELLTQAVQTNALALNHIDTGSSRKDLLELARQVLLAYFVPVGVAGIRLVLDARTNPQLAELFESVLHGQRRQTALTIVRRAAKRGDLSPTTTPGMAIEVIAGTTLSHFLYNPRDPVQNHDRTTPADERFLAKLVNGLLKE